MMMKKMIGKFVLFIMWGLALNTAHANIIGGAVTSGNGTFIELSIPFDESNPDNSVGNNTFQNNNLYAFNEGQNIELLADLAVNDVGGGVAGALTAGTIVASHYVFIDPLNSTPQEGYVDFDSDILAVITSTGLLAASDFLLNNGVIYLNPAARGLEPSEDTVWFSGSRVFVDWKASTPGDYIRVLTEFSPGIEVPESSVFFLMLFGLAGVFFSRRRA
jgi:hypothetical protein